MTSVNTATTAAASTSSTAKSAYNNKSQSIDSKDSLNTTYSDFLKLLTTQLQNQDPLAPMDSDKFTSQLVSFSQVEQQLKSNDQLKKLVDQNTSMINQSGLQYIGLNVRYAGSDISHDVGKTQQISYNLDKAATKVDVAILDAAGKKIWSTTGDVTAGTHQFTWPGVNDLGIEAGAGNYSVAINSFDSTGKPTTIDSSLIGKVDGVETKDGVVLLNIGKQQISQSKVSAAFATMQAANN
ncbi:MAG: flagellar hook assembly protein FlgD [Alphaproteobacteria bacterium]